MMELFFNNTPTLVCLITKEKVFFLPNPWDFVFGSYLITRQESSDELKKWKKFWKWWWKKRTTLKLLNNNKIATAETLICVHPVCILAKRITFLGRQTYADRLHTLYFGHYKSQAFKLWINFLQCRNLSEAFVLMEENHGGEEMGTLL